MDLLRRHAFYIICGVAGAGGVALGITGLQAMPRVLEEMEKAGNLYRDLGSLEAGPVNLDAIETEDRRIELTVRDRDQVMAKAKELYRYEPLVAHVFPNGDDVARREFQTRYQRAMDLLFKSLKSGEPANRTQIDEMRDKVLDEEYEAQQQRSGPGAARSEDVSTGRARTTAGVLTRSGARKDAEARAHMAAAQRIYCYAKSYNLPPNLGPRQRERWVSGLDFDPLLKDTGEVDAALPEDVWRAQIGYWIQKDVVDAIAAINDEAAAEAEKKGETAWVGIMPVKDVISIRVGQEYILSGGELVAGAAPGGYDEALPPDSDASAFTLSASNDLYEVRQFTVKLVMDQRDIPRLIDRLCDRTFHTLLRVAYEAVPPNKDMKGKVYGSEPVVSVVLDFETVFLGELFRPLMPTVVCEALMDEGYGIECPAPEAEEDEEEGD